MTQAEALNILKTGANVFLTGEPGSGKTHTVNSYVAWLRSCGVEPAITASTGIAATHIGGFTVHSWAGIGVRRFLSEQDIDAISQNRRVVDRVGKAKILIIDEVSMLSANTLQMVDAVCREIRHSQEPFGGLQVVFVGDFFQLPPVSRRGDEQGGQESFVSNEEDDRFAFSSPAWKNLNPLVCYLSEQHRQEDAPFLEFLTAVRSAEVGEHHMELLRSRYSRSPKEGITQLYSHNKDVNRINGNELAGLSGEEMNFEMQSRGPEAIVAALKRGCLSPETLSLKVGARVMFTKNDSERRFVNGTLAEVIGFEKEERFPMVKTLRGTTIIAEPEEWRLEDGGRVLGRIIQIPLRLAWAITVHKSQGMSLDAAHMDLSETFEYGQGYVALSRVRTLSGLSLSGLNKKALMIHPDIREKDVEFRQMSENTREVFSKISAGELKTMSENFIRVCGGSFTPNFGGALKRRARGKANRSGKFVSTYEATKELLSRKMSLQEMAEERGVTVGTILSHLETLAEEKKIVSSRDLAHIPRDPIRFRKMKKVFETVREKEKRMPLSTVRAILGNGYGYDELRLARLFM